MGDRYVGVECFSCGKKLIREKRTHKYYCKKFGVNYKPKCNVSCGKTKFVSNKMCDTCRERYKRQTKWFLVKKNCISCGLKFEAKSTSNKKYCDDCRKERYREIGKIIGRKSAAIQVRRSKNEVYFVELCKKEYSNVLTNEPFF